MMKNTKQNIETNMLGFRLESADLVALREAATKSNLSVHEYSKRIVQEHICDGGEFSILKNRVARIENMLRNLGVDIAIGLRQVLLTQEDGDKVDPWLRRELSCSNWKREE